MKSQNFYESPHCIGAQGYYRTTFVKSLVSTDGVIEMFKELCCFWIGDVVASWLPDLKAAAGEGIFFVVKVITEPDQSAQFTIDDGDGQILVQQRIEYTDLGQNVRMFLVFSDDYWVLMLPSEY